MQRANTWLFIGYSFEDEVIIDLLAEIQETLGPSLVRWSYAVIPDLNDYVRDYLQSYKILAIDETTEGFFSSSARTPKIDSLLLPQSLRTGDDRLSLVPSISRGSVSLKRLSKKSSVFGLLLVILLRSLTQVTSRLGMILLSDSISNETSMQAFARILESLDRENRQQTWKKCRLRVFFYSGQRGPVN